MLLKDWQMISHGSDHYLKNKSNILYLVLKFGTTYTVPIDIMYVAIVACIYICSSRIFVGKSCT